MIVDKLNDVLLWVCGIFLTGASWVCTRLFRSIDLAHSRIDRIESQSVDRAFLESQLIPIRQDLNMIVKHLLEDKKNNN